MINNYTNRNNENIEVKIHINSSELTVTTKFYRKFHFIYLLYRIFILLRYRYYLSLLEQSDVHEINLSVTYYLNKYTEIYTAVPLLYKYTLDRLLENERNDSTSHEKKSFVFQLQSYIFNKRSASCPFIALIPRAACINHVERERSVQQSCTARRVSVPDAVTSRWWTRVAAYYALVREREGHVILMLSPLVSTLPPLIRAIESPFNKSGQVHRLVSPLACPFRSQLHAKYVRDTTM